MTKTPTVDPPPRPAPRPSIRVGSRVDPRMRARRIAVQREVGRRRRHRLVLLAGVFGVAVGGVGLALSPALDVDRVEVGGTAQLDPVAVEAAAGIRRGDPLVTLDVARAARGVRALPWVAEVSVERSWWGSVRLEVAERAAVAELSGPGGVVLVDGDGRVLATRPGDAEPSSPGLPSVVGLPAPGPPGSSVGPRASPALAVATGLAGAVGRDVDAVVVVGPDASLSAQLELVDGDDQVDVRLGDARQLPAKLEALATVVASVDLAGLETIDLAVPSVPALTRRSPSPTVSTRARG